MCAAVDDAVPHRVVACVRDADTVAAGPLRDVQRMICRTQQVCRAARPEPDRRHTERGGDDRLGPARKPGDRPLPRRMCLLGGPGREQEAELVAAQPVDRAACSLLLGAQSRGDRGERLVAPGVTERVVQLLEVVEIAEEHRHVAPALPRLPGTELEPLLEGAAVADAGERILEREVGHSRVELGPTDGRGDLPGDRLEETDVARAEGRGGPHRGPPRAHPRPTRRA